MSVNLDRIIAVSEVGLRAVDLLVTALRTATTSIEAAKTQLGDSLSELKKMRTQSSANRAAEDASIDKKFDDEG